MEPETDYILRVTLGDSHAELMHAFYRANDCFKESLSFLEGNGLPLPDITEEDRKEALKIFHQSPTAPSAPTTLGAQRMLDSMLAKYDYSLSDPSAKMRNYVMYKFFELAESSDERISMKALENLAKTNEIGLFSDKLEININQKATVEIESELARLVTGILERRPVKSGFVEGEFTAC
jgi:hypothetical protein